MTYKLSVVGDTSMDTSHSPQRPWPAERLTGAVQAETVKPEYLRQGKRDFT